MLPERIRYMNVSDCLVMIEKDHNLFVYGHASSVTCYAITSDNKYLISGSDDKTVRIWNLFDKKQEAILHGHMGSVTWIGVINNDNDIISYSSDKTFRIWNILERRQEAVFGENIVMTPLGISKDETLFFVFLERIIVVNF